LFWQGRIDVRSSRPPVREDEVDRDKRRQSVEKQKSTKDSEKKGKKKKNLDRQALEARRAKSRQRGEPKEESPSEDDGGDSDDDSDDSEGMASRLEATPTPPEREHKRRGQAGLTAPALTPLPRLHQVRPSRPTNFPLHQRRVAGISPRRRGR